MGYGQASEPITNVSQDSLWRAMLYSARNPGQCGLDVDDVDVRGVAMSGEKYAVTQRTMRLSEKSGSPTVTENIRFNECAQEITFRPVANGVESEEERVYALRTDPLRLEMFSRSSKDGARSDWQAPSSMCVSIFDATVAVAVLNQSSSCEKPGSGASGHAKTDCQQQ